MKTKIETAMKHENLNLMGLVNQTEGLEKEIVEKVIYAIKKGGRRTLRQKARRDAVPAARSKEQDHRRRRGSSLKRQKNEWGKEVKKVISPGRLSISRMKTLKMLFSR